MPYDNNILTFSSVIEIAYHQNITKPNLLAANSNAYIKYSYSSPILNKRGKSAQVITEGNSNNDNTGTDDIQIQQPTKYDNKYELNPMDTKMVHSVDLSIQFNNVVPTENSSSNFIIDIKFTVKPYVPPV